MMFCPSVKSVCGFQLDQASAIIGMLDTVLNAAIFWFYYGHSSVSNDFIYKLWPVLGSGKPQFY